MITRGLDRFNRILRAPEGHGGGDSSTGDNNSGPVDEFEGFWSADDEGDGGAQASQQPAPSTSPANPLEALNQHLNSVQFSPVLDEQVMERLNQGDLAGFNESLANHGRNVMRETLVRTAQMMHSLQERMQAQVDRLVQERLGTAKAEEALTAAIPAASNPMLAPVVKGIYAQALKKAGGDTSKAVQMTKQFLAKQIESSADDLNYQVVPVSSDAAANHNRRAAKIDWFEEIGVDLTRK